jgi:hypothetical protein
VSKCPVCGEEQPCTDERLADLLAEENDDGSEG